MQPFGCYFGLSVGFAVPSHVAVTANDRHDARTEQDEAEKK